MAPKAKKSTKAKVTRTQAPRAPAAPPVVTKMDVDNLALLTHAVLKASYYTKKEITKEEFDAAHMKLWNDHEDDLVKRGFLKEEERIAIL